MFSRSRSCTVKCGEKRARTSSSVRLKGGPSFAVVLCRIGSCSVATSSMRAFRSIRPRSVSTYFVRRAGSTATRAPRSKRHSKEPAVEGVIRKKSPTTNRMEVALPSLLGSAKLRTSKPARRSDAATVAPFSAMNSSAACRMPSQPTTLCPREARKGMSTALPHSGKKTLFGKCKALMPSSSNSGRYFSRRGLTSFMWNPARVGFLTSQALSHLCRCFSDAAPSLRYR
mmetsp:Transcript_5033/g.10244  ORF Transcript_5033/g.10244 Transcript_5033/m.10244 type:complete len:228 (+) Transcript_5033:340-1023(+)